MYAGALHRQKKDAQPPQGNQIIENATPRRIGSYQILESIGRGGFGIVYRGLNLTSAETVAVKRVSLRNVPFEELESIKLEIQLMQGLDHPNIVKYRDAIAEDVHLNIILEFVENGSLTSLLNKFDGCFPENLVSVYIAQVVSGLSYLHSQGVIHRDIKGANILSTKEGLVKLADFGVATKLNETKDAANAVVGTPYWMAPEIIEMSGIISPACDIWSVGCTVIELLTGKPPYFDMQQMAALFRIVQDDHPPLPDDISKHGTDFLLECFQKDPNRRISAQQLLKHPWIKEHVQQPTVEKVQAKKTQKIEIDEEDDWDESLDIEEKIDESQPTKTQPQSNDKDEDWDNDEDDIFAGFDDDDDDFDGFDNIGAVKTSQSNKSDPLHLDAGADPLDNLNRFAEHEDDDDDNSWAEIIDGKPQDQIATSNWDDGDIFDDIVLDDDDGTDENSVILNKFDKLTASLSLGASIDQVLDTCLKMATMFEENTEVLRSAVTTRGVIPIIEMLEYPDSSVLLAILRLVNLIVKDNQKFQQNMSLVGLLPALIKFSGKAYGHKIRLEASHFIRQFCYMSDFNRKMFVACGGIPAIVLFLRENYQDNKELVLNAIDCMIHIFDIKTSPRNDFCRLFCKFNVLLPLAQTFLSIHVDSLKSAHGLELPSSKVYEDNCHSKLDTISETRLVTSAASTILSDVDLEEYVVKIATLFEWFSCGDNVVKTHLINVDILQVLVSMLKTLSQKPLLLILKSLRAVSMNIDSLDALADAGAIPAVIPFLSSKYMENQAQALQIMYYLCYFSTSRLESATDAGIIPHLQQIITSKLPFNQFAYSVLFFVSNASQHTRMELRKHDGIQFLLDILSDPCWGGNSLEALALWNTSEPETVGPIVALPSNISRLLPLIRAYYLGNSSTVSLSLTKYVSSSTQLLRTVGRFFIPHILSAIVVHREENNTRNTFLTLLKDILMCDVPNIDSIGRKYDLVGFLKNLARDSSATVVAARASNILEYIHKHIPSLFEIAPKTVHTTNDDDGYDEYDNELQ